MSPCTYITIIIIMKISSTRNETIILMFVTELCFLQLFPINYVIKTSELFQNEFIEIQQNGEWSEFFKVCQPARESLNNMLVANKEQTANASTENSNDTNDDDVDD